MTSSRSARKPQSLSQSSARDSGSNRHCSWLASVADFVEYPELPPYLRPHVTLKVLSATSQSSSNRHQTTLPGKAVHYIRPEVQSDIRDFLFPERCPSTVVKVRRPGPYVPRQQTRAVDATGRDLESSGVVTIGAIRSQIADAIDTVLPPADLESDDRARDRKGRVNMWSQPVPVSQTEKELAQNGFRYNSNKKQIPNLEESWDMDVDWVVPTYDDAETDENQCVQQVNKTAACREMGHHSSRPFPVSVPTSRSTPEDTSIMDESDADMIIDENMSSFLYDTKYNEINKASTYHYNDIPHLINSSPTRSSIKNISSSNSIEGFKSYESNQDMHSPSLTSTETKSSKSKKRQSKKER